MPLLLLDAVPQFGSSQCQVTALLAIERLHATDKHQGSGDYHLWFGTKEGVLGVVDAVGEPLLAHATGIGCVRTLVQTLDRDGTHVVLVGGEQTHDRRERERSESLRSVIAHGVVRTPIRQQSAPATTSTPVFGSSPLLRRQGSLLSQEEAYPSPVATGTYARAGHVLVWEAALEAAHGLR